MQSYEWARLGFFISDKLAARTLVNCTPEEKLILRTNWENEGGDVRRLPKEIDNDLIWAYLYFCQHRNDPFASAMNVLEDGLEDDENASEPVPTKTERY